MGWKLRMKVEEGCKEVEVWMCRKVILGCDI